MPDPTILVGIANPQTMAGLIAVSGALARGLERELVITHAVQVPSQMPLDAARESPEVSEAGAKVGQAIELAQAAGVRARGSVKLARSWSSGLVSAAEAERAELLVVGYSPQPSGEQRSTWLMHQLSREAPCPIIVAHLRGDGLGRTLAAVAPEDDNEALILRVARGLAAGAASELSALQVCDEGQQEAAARSLEAALARAQLAGTSPTVVRAEDVTAELLARCQAVDLAIVGTQAKGALATAFFGSRAQQLAEGAACTVLLAHAPRRTGA